MICWNYFCQNSRFKAAFMAFVLEEVRLYCTSLSMVATMRVRHRVNGGSRRPRNSSCIGNRRISLTSDCAIAAASLCRDGPDTAALRRANPDFIFAGMRAGCDLAAQHTSADLFLFLSIKKTFGNVLKETLPSGLAVVAHDSPKRSKP